MTDRIYQCIEPNHDWLNQLKEIGYNVPNSEDYYTIRELMDTEEDIKIFGEPAILLCEIVNETVPCTLQRSDGVKVRWATEFPFPLEAFREVIVDLNKLMGECEKINVKEKELTLIGEEGMLWP